MERLNKDLKIYYQSNPCLFCTIDGKTV